MKVLLITIDSLRWDCIPKWFLDKHKPTVYTNAYTYYAGTIPSLTSFYTGVPPVKHGIGSHHAFYRANIRYLTIFELLNKQYVYTAFASDESLMYSIQAIRGAIKHKPDSIEVVLNNHDPIFVAYHIFKPVHAPYGSPQIMELLTKGRKDNFSHWKDKKFLTKAKEQYLEVVDETFRAITELLSITELTHLIISADHGEAFGEEGLYGHENMFIEPVLRIPLLVLPGDGLNRTETVYPSEVVKLIVNWFRG